MAPKKENNKRVSKAELKAAKQRVEFLDIILNSETKITKMSDKQLKNRIAERNVAQETVNLYDKQLAAQEKITEAQEDVNEELAVGVSLTSDLNKLAEKKHKLAAKAVVSGKSQSSILSQAFSQEEMFLQAAGGYVGVLSQSNKLNEDMQEMIREDAMLIENLGTGTYDLAQLNEKIADAEHRKNQWLRDNVNASEEEREQAVGYYDTLKGVLQVRVDIGRAQEKEKVFLEAADSILGGMGSKAKEIYETFKNLGKSTALLTLGIAAALAILAIFSSKLDSIGDTFGTLGVTKFSDQLMSADEEMQKLGYDSGSAGEAALVLSNNFGMAFDEAIKIAPVTAEIARSMGGTVAEAAKLLGTLTQIGGLTADEAENLTKSAEQMAVAAGVAPGQIMKEVSAATETYARFAKDGGKNIFEAAIQAKKLGTELDTIAGVSDSLLNFQTSLNSEIEASIMIGRQLNFQKARELALNNDISGAMDAVLEQLGGEEEFNRLNALQRKALADSIGVGVDQLAKFVGKQDESLSLAGQLSKEKGFDEILGKDGISTLTSITNELKSLGAQLVKVFGPALNFILKAVKLLLTPFSLLVDFFDRFKGAAVAAGIALGVIFLPKMIESTRAVYDKLAAGGKYIKGLFSQKIAEEAVNEQNALQVYWSKLKTAWTGKETTEKQKKIGSDQLELGLTTSGNAVKKVENAVNVEGDMIRKKGLVTRISALGVKIKDTALTWLKIKAESAGNLVTELGNKIKISSLVVGTKLYMDDAKQLAIKIKRNTIDKLGNLLGNLNIKQKLIAVGLAMKENAAEMAGNIIRGTKLTLGQAWLGIQQLSSNLKIKTNAQKLLGIASMVKENALILSDNISKGIRNKLGQTWLGIQQFSSNLNIKANAQKLLGISLSAKENTLTLARNIIRSVGNTLGGIWSKIQQKSIGSSIKINAQKLLGIGLLAKENALALVRNTIQGVGNTLGGIWSKIQQSSIGSSIKINAQKLFGIGLLAKENALILTSNMAKGIRNTIQGIGNTLGGIGSTIQQKSIGLGIKENVITTAGNIIKGARNAISTSFIGIQNMLTGLNLKENITMAAGNVIRGTRNTLSTMWSGLQQSMIGLNIKENVSNIAGNAIKTTRNILDSAYNIIKGSSMSLSVQNAAIRAIEITRETAYNVAKGAGNILLATYNTLKQVSILSSIKSAAVIAYETITRLAQNVAVGLGSTILIAFNALKSTSILLSVQSALVAGIETAKVIALNIAEGIGNVVRIAGNALKITSITLSLKSAAVATMEAVKSGIAATANIVRAISGFFAGAAAGSAATLGIGAVPMIAIATGGVAAMLAAVAAAPRFKTLPEGKQAEIGKGIAIADAGESITKTKDLESKGNMDLTPVVNAINTLQKEMVTLREDMNGYLGMNGSTARGIGTEVVSAINRAGT